MVERTSPVTVRINEELAQQLEGLALVDDNRFANQMREAVRFYINLRLSDPSLEQQKTAAQERTDALLDSLLVE